MRGRVELTLQWVVGAIHVNVHVYLQSVVNGDFAVFFELFEKLFPNSLFFFKLLLGTESKECQPWVLSDRLRAGRGGGRKGEREGGREREREREGYTVTGRSAVRSLTGP